MDSLIMLWKVLAQELGEWCGISTALDAKDVERRCENEGMSFLAITLPQFCKDFEKSLEQGVVSRDLFAHFRRRGELPVFLGGFFDLVFERSTGRLLERPSVDSIFSIRQLTAVFGKILVACSKEREAVAIEGYLQTERDLREADQYFSEEDESSILRVSALLFRDVLTLVDNDIHQGNIKGKHGPGATADRKSGNQKYDFTEWPERIEAELPFWEQGIPNRGFNYLYDRVKILLPGQERPVKVTLVPKTPKTPRIISVEPTANMFLQQGLGEKFVEYLETDKTVSGMIGFTDQRPNQVLAQIGSLYGELATLDLKEASDRVSDRHVVTMLSRFPALQRAVAAVRSTKAVMPDGSIVTLVKFASMGSALTFPVEAMVFLTMIFIGVEQELDRPLTRGDIHALSGKVRVYGDDLIVPVEYVHSTIRVLESFGYRVNSSKSFWNGKFRESCGKDFFDGADVTLTRVRRVFPTSLADVSEILSLVSLRNQFYTAGFWGTARHLDEVLGPLLRNRYPVLELDESSIAFTGKPGNGSPVLGRQSYLPYQAERVCRDLQVPLVKGWHVFSQPPKSQVSGEGALLKWFLKRGEQPFADVDHLERSGRPKAVNIKLGWKPPF